MDSHLFCAPAADDSSDDVAAVEHDHAQFLAEGVSSEEELPAPKPKAKGRPKKLRALARAVAIQPVVTDLQSLSLDMNCIDLSPRCTSLVSGCLATIHQIPRDSALFSMDESIKTLASTMLDKHYIDSSKSMLDSSIGVSRKRSTRHIIRLAAMCWESDVLSREKLESSVVASYSRSQLLSYEDFAMYDESPMNVRVRSSTGHGIMNQMQSAASALEDEHPIAADDVICCRDEVTAATSKILQNSSQYAMLVKLDETRYRIIMGDTICPLMNLERNTSACLLAAHMRLSAVSTHASSFRLKGRPVSIDSFSANDSSERALVKLRGDGWTNSSIHCQVHVVAGIVTKAFGPLDSQVTGLLRAVLSLQLGPAMNYFRKCLAAEIRSRWKVKFGDPPASCLDYKRFVLKLFLAHCANKRERQLLLVLLPQGDWKSSQIDVWVRPGQLSVKRILLHNLVSGLIRALVPSKLVIFKRNRWKGCEKPLDSLGILEAVHGLLTPTYKRFVAGYLSNSLGASVVGPASVNVGAPMCIEDGVPSVDNPPPGQSAGGGGGPSGGDDSSWAAKNSQDRAFGLAWVSSPQGVMQFLYMFRVCYEPFRQLIDSKLRLCSKRWCVEQLAMAATALEDGDVTTLCRDFSVVVASSCRDELHCQSQLGKLYENTYWEHFPVIALISDSRSTAFRLVSKSGALVEQNLCRENRSFPIRLFQVLRDPDFASTLAGIPLCVLCDWARSLVREFADNLGGSDLKAVVLVRAIVWCIHIASAESRHSAIRRIITSRSVQTNVIDMVDVSALWILMRARLRGHQTPMDVMCGKSPKRKDIIRAM
jgi:hypothetical protein